MRSRHLRGWLRTFERVVLVSIPIVGIAAVLQVFLFFGESVWIQQYLSFLLGLVLAAVPLRVPATRGAQDHVPWYDYLLSVLGLMAGLYAALFYQNLLAGIGIVSIDKVIPGVLILLLILESCRRTVGWFLTGIVLAFLLYAHFTYVFPGPLHGRGVPWGRLATYLYLDQGAVLGIALRVISTIVLVFIFFGVALLETGGGKFFTDLALSLLGRYRGGSAKVAVIASSLFGTVSGSAVANVATIGVVTIPLMKRTGYAPHFAAGVEATSSTGGQIMPPVMGAAAFLMAEFLGIPYARVALAAALPAILYYLCLFVQIDRRAAKRDMRGLSPELVPSLRRVVIEGWWFLIPVLVLIYGLFVLYLEPAEAGLFATAAVFLVSALKERTLEKFKKMFTMLEKTGGDILEIAVICAAAGMIIGVLAITGFGFSFPMAVIQISGGHFTVLLLLSALCAVILGMGMPVTAAYIIVVLLIAPSLIQLGMPALSAHMFVFYFAVLSFLTPPVCLASYTAASIAEADPMRTATQAMRLGISAYLVPFLFPLVPALLFQGGPFQILVSFVQAAVGLSILAVAIEGYGFLPLGWVERLLLMLGGAALTTPFWPLLVLGIVICVPLLGYQFYVFQTRRAAGETGERLLET